MCGSLADGKQRFPREGDDCECKDGWAGLNCNRKSTMWALDDSAEILTVR